MEVKTKTEKTYDVMGLTETQAQDLLNIAACHEAEFNASEEETLDTVRQALLTAGLTKKVTI